MLGRECDGDGDGEDVVGFGDPVGGKEGREVRFNNLF